MALITSKAVVLKTWKLSETSLIVQLYTREYGKVRVVAKGARNLKSPFKGCLEPLSLISVIYYDKPNRDLQTLSKLDLIDPHLSIIGDLEKTSLALAAAELVDKAVAGEEAYPQVYDLLTGTLELINEGCGFTEGLFWYFENRFVDLMGYRPTWDSCLKCSSSLRAAGGYLHPSSGGLVCRSCGAHLGGLALSGETLEVLYWLQNSEQNESAALDPSPAQKEEIRKTFDFYLRSHIDHLKPLKSLDIYYRCQHTEQQLTNTQAEGRM